MEFSYLYLLILIGLVWLAAVVDGQREDKAWRELAATLGFDLEAGSRGIHGTDRGLRLSICRRTEGEGENSVVYTVLGVWGPHSVTISAEPIRRSMFDWRDPVVANTGDPRLDTWVSVSGPERIVAASLNHRARTVLCELIFAGGQVNAGRVELKVTGSLVAAKPKLMQTLATCLAAARGLCLPKEGVCAALASNSSSDPVPQVRARNLEVLGRHFPRSREFSLALEAALSANEPVLSLAAATLRVGRREFETLVGLAAGAPAEYRVGALEHLLERYPSADLGGLLALALRAEQAQLQLVAVRALRSGRSLDQFRALLEKEEPPRFTPATETSLVEILASTSLAHQLAATLALGDFGTLEAVEPLLPVARNLAPRGGVRRAAREAIDRIQHRLSGSPSGSLSLSRAAEQGGGLSLGARP